MGEKASDCCFGDAYLRQIELFCDGNKLQNILLNAVFCEMDKNEKEQLLVTLRDLDLNKENENAKDAMIHRILTGNADNEIKQELDDLLIDNILTEILQNEQKSQSENEQLIFLNDDCHENESEDADMSFDIEMMDELEIPTMNKKISVPRFCEIMEHTEKEYDIDALVKCLEPTPSGHIRMSSINSFDGVIRSRKSICKMMDEMVDSIAKEYFCNDELIEID